MIEYQRMKHASGESKKAAGGSVVDQMTPGSNMQQPSGHTGDRLEPPSGTRNLDRSGHSRGTDQKNTQWTEGRRTSGSPTAQRGRRPAGRDSSGGVDIEDVDDTSPMMRSSGWPASGTPSDGDAGSDGSPAVRLREIRPSDSPEPHRQSYAAIMAVAPPNRADLKLRPQPNGSIALSPALSDRTEGIPGRGEISTDRSDMRPIVATFGKNIVVNRNSQPDRRETNDMMV